MRLDETCNIPAGERDAIHVPFVVVRVEWEDLHPKDEGGKYQFEKAFKPGDFIKFTDESCTRIKKCERAEAHGVVNPFIEEIDSYDNVVVLVMPGLSGPVRHHFDIDFNSPKIEKELLQIELEQYQSSDPGCADCYEIRNNRIIRN